MHEISPGAIQKSNGLKVTCLMSLYFKSEEDTMKMLIFLRLYLATLDTALWSFCHYNKFIVCVNIPDQ